MKTSVNFRNRAIMAIVAILFFIVSYLALFLLAAALTVFCAWAGIMIIVLSPGFVTILLGLGLASLGFLILFFLIKFLFKPHRIDRSHLIEVKRKEQPVLFDLISEVVQAVDTAFPKSVYLAPDVNAAVFYDSSFWSMFLPIRKNLQIGLGLVNTINRTELKAILAHEFGHFSQRSMKVGSYVYNVNQVLHNMLYDNDSYDRMISRWAGASGFFALFAIFAVKIVNGIQWVLRLLYAWVNKSYLALSREMEFQADEIAARVTGFEPLKNALLRMPLADHAFNEVLSFYENKLSDNIKSQNLYAEQFYVMRYLAGKNGQPLVEELPMTSPEEFSKFNKSKLEIKNQWTSHPSTEERVKRLENTGLKGNSFETTLANDTITNLVSVQQVFTSGIFQRATESAAMTTMAFTDFQASYEQQYQQNTFPTVYNNYYDSKDPFIFDIEAPQKPAQPVSSSEELYNAEKVEMVLSTIALANDMATIEHISNNLLPVKTFDYDGQKYRKKDAKNLLVRLKEEEKTLIERIKENDMAAFDFFSTQEKNTGKTPALSNLYHDFFHLYDAYAKKYPLYLQLSNSLEFIQYTLPIEQIKDYFRQIEPMEENMKADLSELMTDARYLPLINQAIHDDLEKYLSKKWEYFGNQKYFDENLGVLFQAMNHYHFLLSQALFLSKKRLLDYQAELIVPQ